MSRVRSPIAAMEGRTLRRLRIDEWPNAMFMARTPPFEVWLSRDFLVQLFHDNGSDRLSVCRTTIDTATVRSSSNGERCLSARLGIHSPKKGWR